MVPLAAAAGEYCTLVLGVLGEHTRQIWYWFAHMSVRQTPATAGTAAWLQLWCFGRVSRH